MKHTEADEIKAREWCLSKPNHRGFELGTSNQSPTKIEKFFPNPNSVECYLAGLLKGRSEKQGEVVKSFDEYFKTYEHDLARYPTAKELWLDCAQSMEASHLKELPEGFDSSISAEQYFIWCKHHQKAAELRLNESSEMKRKLVDMESKHREEIEKLKAELGERGKRIIELGGCILEVHAQGLEALYDKKWNDLIKSITTNKGKEKRDETERNT